MNRNQREYRSGGSIVSRALARFGSLIWACVLFFWKICLFGAALPVMFLGAFCLFLGGVVLVLLLQGYPLIGVGIGTLGLTMSSFGLTALILSWVFTGKKDRPARTENGEAAYTVSPRMDTAARQTEYSPAGVPSGAAGKTAAEEEQDKTGTSAAASQRAGESALQTDYAQKFTEKTADEPQN